MPLPDFANNMQIVPQALWVINAMWASSPASAAYQWALNLWGPPIKGFQADAANENVTWVCLEYPQAVVYLVGGCTRRQHVARYLRGMYWETLVSSGVNDVNAYVTSMSEALYSGINSSGITKTKPQLLFGHSIGGAVVQHLAFGMQAVGGFGDRQVHSFGSPKWCKTVIANSIQLPYHWRWMNEGDPVPYIYPAIGDAPSLVLTAPVEWTVSGNSLVQTAGGVVIRPNATYYVADYPPLPERTFIGSLLAWWNSISGEPSHPHHVLTYYDRISRFIPPESAIRPENVQGTNNPERLHNAPTDREINDIAREQAELVRDVPDGVPAHGANAQTKVFRYKRVGEVYQVFMLDQMVCAFKGRSKAKKMVAGGNKMAANYIRSPLGATFQFDDAMKNFLELVDLDAL